MVRPLRAVTCAGCGAKVREDRVRCLRCGQLLETAPDRPWLPVTGRGVVTAAAVVAAVALTGTWIGTSRPVVRPTTTMATPASRVSSTPPPSRRATTDTPAIPTAPGFLDADRAGRAALRRGDPSEAADAFERAVREHPDDAEVLNGLGQALVRQGRFADAVARFDRAIALVPGKWSYRFNRARAYGLLQQWPRAIEDYTAALELFPGDHVTEFNLGLALDKAGRTAEGLDHLHRAAADQPQDSSLQLAVAVVADRAQRTADAVAAYGRFLALNPAEPDASRARGRLAALTTPTSGNAAPVPPEVATPPVRPF